MVSQMRSMEMSLSRDRADLARQRNDLQRLQADIDREIEARLTLETPDGPCPLHYFVTWLRPAKNTIDLRFDNCTVSLSCRPAETLEIRSDIDGRHAASLSAKGAGAATVYQAFYLEWTAFLDGVRAREASKFSARSCLPTVRAVEALYAQGKPE